MFETQTSLTISPEHFVRGKPSLSPVREKRIAPSALPAHMTRRGNVLYFVRKIPADAKDAFPGHSSVIMRSLGTNLIEKAKVLLAVEVTEFDLQLANFRKQRATKQANSINLVRPGAKNPIELAPVALSTEEIKRHELVRAIESNLAQLRSMSSIQEVGAVPGTASITKSVAQVAKPKSTRSRAQAAEVKAGMTNGVVNPSLLHLYEDWKKGQTRPRTLRAVGTVVMAFRELHGSIPVASITRQHARDFRDQLVEKGLSRVTVENRLGFLATLVRHGMDEMIEDLAINPFERIKCAGIQGKRPPKDRRAFEVRELNLIFQSPLYLQGHRPNGQAREAAHWMPILGPFVGARIEELAQLRVADVQRVNGVWCVRICDLAAEQHIKNVGSFRRVPLHAEVIQCGFLLHVAAMAKAGHERVFPSLSNQNAHSTYSNALGKWFGRYLSDIGLEDRRLDFHSYRYTFKQQCSLSGISDEVRDALAGHWLIKSDSGRTYMKGENRQYPFPALDAAIKKLQYEELRMQHLYVSEPLKDVETILLR